MLPASRFAPLPAHAATVAGGVTSPQGYLAAGVPTGVKRRGKLDLGLLKAPAHAVSAAAFTQNAAAAAPVRLTRQTSDCARLRAVVVNAGNANACTGKQGLADAARMRLLTADHLRLPVECVAVASTGIIGLPMPMEKIEPGIDKAAHALSHEGGTSFAQAIRTTDKHAKQGALTVDLPEGRVKLGFAAKGCGMISPNMATMLCFVTCDAVVGGADWHDLFHAAVGASFNRITVDGQESTNDMVMGFCGGGEVRPGEEGLHLLGEALTSGLLSLALAIVADGEGATRTVKLSLSGARDALEAERVARAVANSPLVKTAFYGGDANWGRVMQAIGMALGRDGHAALPAAIAYEDVAIVADGQPAPLGDAARDRLAAVMAQPEIELSVRLNGGPAGGTVYFSDLTHDYVTLNAEYTT